MHLLLEEQDQEDLKVLKDLQVLEDIRELTALLALLDLPALLDQEELKELLDQRVALDLQDQLDLLAQDQQDREDILDVQAHQVAVETDSTVHLLTTLALVIK